MINDLRDYLKQAEELGLCKHVNGADWDLEIGACTELQKLIPDSPVLVFDDIKGYEPGYRVASNLLNNPKLFALVHGLPLNVTGVELVKAWREKKAKECRLSRPVEVKTGSVKENIHLGEDIDIFEFPVPKWHELDGGRYIGTGHMVLQRDPEEGWVNVGTYRVQGFDRDVATIHYIDGRHGDIIRKKYWDKGLSAPAVVVCGQEPLLWSMSTYPLPWGVSEFDYVEWLKGKPFEVVKGEVTDLPIPAAAEIVLEGEMVLPGGETRIEGPFGEWPGYVGGKPREEPIFKIKAVLHRNNPILTGAPPNVGPYDFYFGRSVMRCASLWDELDQKVPGVIGIWQPTESRGLLLTVVSIKQMFAGHAKRVAMAVAGSYTAAWMSRYIIIVDDDIDASNIGEVLWALATRCDPETAIDISGGYPGMRSDPLLSPEQRKRDNVVHSRAILYACRPYYWKDDFPPSVKSSPEVLARVKEKFNL
ncbi:UbiD family decarboxylase [Chloroflexota bacterium]